MAEGDRARAESFGVDAARYDRARPRYPPALVAELLKGAPFAPRVLDIGAGTGIASAMFVAAGAEVLAVEADARMAALAARRGLAVEVARFEDWDPDGRRFSLAISAQAWHWIDPQLGAAKVANVLNPDGRLALFWNHGTLVGRPARALAAVYARLAPGLSRSSPMQGASPSSVAEARLELQRSGRFDGAALRSWSWRSSYQTPAWLELLASHSGYQALAPADRAELLDAVAGTIELLGGTIEVKYTTRLVVARRCSKT